MRHVLLFIAAMWGLIIAGGGVAVHVLGPASVAGLGEYDRPASSALKAAAAVSMVAVWVLALARVKDYVFRRHAGW